MTSNLKRFLFPAVLLGALALYSGGCALGDRSIALKYTAVGTSVAKDPPTVAIMKFDDARPDKVTVGEVRDGLGIKTAKVVLNKDSDAGGWVANALAAELEKAGVKVLTVDSLQAAGNHPVISGALTHCYVAMLMTYTGQVKVQVIVTRSSVPVLQKEYVGGNSALALAVNSGDYEKVIEKSLQDAMKQMVPDIMKAIQ